METGLSSNNRCKNCAGGKWSSAIGLTDGFHCDPCDNVGYFCPPGTLNKTDHPCPIGMFADEIGLTVCKVCPAGTYQDLTAQTSCMLCGKGKFLNDKNNPVYHESELDCEICKGNTFNEKRGQPRCTSCKKGWGITSGDVADHDNATDCRPVLTCKDPDEYNDDNKACMTCPGGSTCDGVSKRPCDYGKFCVGDGTEQPCPKGRFGIKRGKISELLACNDCPAGTFQPLPGRQSCPGMCAVGYYSLGTEGKHSTMLDACGICVQGAYCQAGAIFYCPKGTFNNETGGKSTQDCQPCGYDYYSTKIGAKLDTTCQPCGNDQNGNALRTTTETAGEFLRL